MRFRSRHLVSAVLAGATLLAAGCQTLDGAQHVVDRADLLGRLATRLEQSSQLSYQADYQLAGGASGTIAQARNPSRVAYTYPGGKLIMVPASVTTCQAGGTQHTCTVTATGSPNPDPVAVLQPALVGHGMIAPPVVISLLNATALDADATVTQRDTTIAGQHATCVTASAVDNAPASAFEACITADGVLASFAGTVNTTRVEIAMTTFRASVAPDAFNTPAGARLLDQRVRQS